MEFEIGNKLLTVRVTVFCSVNLRETNELNEGEGTQSETRDANVKLNVVDETVSRSKVRFRRKSPVRSERR